MNVPYYYYSSKRNELFRDDGDNHQEAQTSAHCRDQPTAQMGPEGPGPAAGTELRARATRCFEFGRMRPRCKLLEEEMQEWEREDPEPVLAVSSLLR